MRSEIARDLGMTNVMGSRSCFFGPILERLDTACTGNVVPSGLERPGEPPQIYRF